MINDDYKNGVTFHYILKFDSILELIILLLYLLYPITQR